MKIYNSSFDHIPRCYCGGLISPNVVCLVNLSETAYEEAYRASQQADLFLSVGTFCSGRPAAVCHNWIRKWSFLVEINIVETVLTPFTDLFLKGAADEILPQFNREYQYLLMQV